MQICCCSNLGWSCSRFQAPNFCISHCLPYWTKTYFIPCPLQPSSHTCHCSYVYLSCSTSAMHTASVLFPKQRNQWSASSVLVKIALSVRYLSDICCCPESVWSWDLCNGPGPLAEPLSRPRNNHTQKGHTCHWPCACRLASLCHEYRSTLTYFLFPIL